MLDRLPNDVLSSILLLLCVPPVSGSWRDALTVLMRVRCVNKSLSSFTSNHPAIRGLIELIAPFRHCRLNRWFFPRRPIIDRDMAALRAALSVLTHHAWGMSPVAAAVWFCGVFCRGCPEGVGMLLAHRGINPNTATTAIEYAVAGENADALRILLADPRCDPAANRSIAVRSAAWSGSIDVLDQLLAYGQVDPTAGGNDATLVAAERGHWDVVAVLLADYRVTPGAKHDIMCACVESRDTGLLERLLADPEINPADNNSEVLVAAFEFGTPEAMDLLLRDGRADPTVLEN